MPETIPKQILVVDDEEPVRMICQRMLEPLGYVVETAVNGDAALACADQKKFDLVLTDYRMPGVLNGLELGQLIKKSSPHTQIILMTAFPAVDTAVGTLRIGAFDYLVKPFDRSELLHCVKTCLERLPAA